ncbi:serine hydrolase domain-containing protein [Marinicellulosiphila megalodicopiae]|uniref:serine hydrolase domain-containing protein n=1 Tax=Marinicellulosiphila megalodicopiae TaxID=2724896 RepID=UPI003BB1F45C
MNFQLKNLKKQSLLKKTLISFGLLGCILGAQAQNQLPNFKSEFGKITGDMPGCAVGIILDGKLIHEQYYGMANIQYNVLNDKKTQFNMGSISKHITAAVIFRLEKDGVINTNDTLIKYYPDGPAWFDKITLSHLIEHKSGLPDYVNDPVMTTELFKAIGQTPEITSALLVGLPVTHEQIVKAVLQELNNFPSPTFEPGTYATYSNTGYLFLGDIINIATGKDLNHWANHYIFEPNKLENITVHNNSSSELKWAATGYSPSPYGNGYSSLVETLVSFGDTGVITSLHDFTKWMTVLNHANDSDSVWNGFLKEYSRDKTKNSSIGLYDNGFFIKKHKNNTIYAHNGQSLDLMTSDFWVSPEQKIGYVQMCNTEVRKVPSKYKIFKYVEEYLKLEEK